MTIKQIIINNTWDKEISDQEYLEKYTSKIVT